jgi:formylglycine-generating enzyme required for sulfatase activity
MGSPETEAGRYVNEIQNRVRINRTFALGSKPVTVEQFNQFIEHDPLPAVHTRLPDLPVVIVDWYDAAKYCNALSKREGFLEEEWCFEIRGRKAKPKANYLKLTGYRLPTEAEMEYAIRAGSTTARFFGETQELLSNYAWHSENSQGKPWPVGSLKPNDFGLFDVQGNVFAWCMDRYKEYPEGKEMIDDTEGELTVIDSQRRAMRGGSFTNPGYAIRSADRNSNVPAVPSYYLGFRVARTIAP